MNYHWNSFVCAEWMPGALWLDKGAMDGFALALKYWKGDQAIQEIDICHMAIS